MATRTRIERLEKRCPVGQSDGTTVEPDLNFRVAGLPRSEVQRRAIRALETAIADPRATDIQRETWRAEIMLIEPALRWELESEKRCACPECEYPLHDSVDGGGYKCRRCGCPVHVHGDGHVTDARPSSVGNMNS